MVKLIRLASKNNCNFDANFDNDIIIEPNSSIAVLNATFKTTSGSITITDEINEISFVGTVNPANTAPLTSHVCKLTNASYTGIPQISNFIKNLWNTINGTLNCQFSTNAGEGNPNFNSKQTNANFGAWELGFPQFDESGNLIIVNEIIFFFAYAPLLTPLGATAPNGIHVGFGTRNSAFWRVSNNLLGNVDLNRIALRNGVARDNGTLHKCQVDFNKPAMCKGTGLYMVRVRNYADNGTGQQDNGFGMGITFGSSIIGPEADTDPIPEAKRNLEIYFNREGEPYEYRIKEGPPETSTFTAARASLTTYPAVADHDVMWIRIRGDANPVSPTYQKHIIEGGVWQEPGGVATEQILFSRALTDEENYKGLKPYMYVRGADGEVEADAMCYSADPFSHPWGVPNGAGQIFSQINWNENYADGYVPAGVPNNQPNDYRILTSTTAQDLRSGSLGQFAPRVIFDRWSNIGLTFTTQLQMHRDLWNLIGFENDQISNNGDLGIYQQKIGNTDLELVNMIGVYGSNEFILDSDDNFMVILDERPVDSYDASKESYQDQNTDALAARTGRRKNIIMTIPVSEESGIGKDGLVQFSTNTPIFIDFLNAQRVNIRNLSLRILRKDFDPVITGQNNSILTLLIKSGGNGVFRGD